MSLSPQFLDELRLRTTLSALIGRSVKLIRAGREFKACCPFHNEKTPSFTVNDEKGFYHCFGCGAHGDAIRYLTDARGLAFMDAVKELAEAAGMDVPAPDPRAQAKAERAIGLYDVMEAAARWYVEQLGGIQGAEARAYLDKRGVDPATRDAFGFGLAPDSRGKLKTALKEFGNERLIEAGLLIQPEDDREPYDRFRNRLMFPIRDARGRCIAFSGRILGPGEPKYVNSPDTPLFDKGRTLFNLDKAGPASRASRRVVVVEGQMDVVAIHRAGIAEVVAPLGTALTENQLSLLWKLSPAPLMCFDGDAAGQKAAIRAALRALPHVGPGRSLSFVTLPGGQDPDDIVRTGGRTALDALLGQAEPLVDRLWRHERDAEPLTTPEQRAGLRRRLLDHVATIGDQDVRDQYRSELLSRYGELFRPQRPAWQDRPQRQGSRRQAWQQKGHLFASPQGASAQVKAVGSGGLAGETARAVLAGLVRYPEVIADHAEAIAALPLAQKPTAALRDSLLDAALMHGTLDREALATILAAKGMAAPIEQLGLENGLAFSFNRRDAEPERARRDLVLVIDTLAAQPGLEAALRAATARLKEAGDEASFDEQQRLRSARDEADRQLATLFESGED